MIRSPRAIIALLTLLNLVNYVDRFVVMAVGPKLQNELGLSDAELGLVVSVFMFGYFLTSPLFGWLGDRYPRRGLIAAGVAVWSVATVASGFATSLGGMLATRVAVGIGEASYATLGPTIIDDVATPASKNRTLAIFYVAIPVGSALGFLLGGWLQQLWGWRAAFFVAGGPGILLALLTLLVAEPDRGGASGEAAEPSPPAREAWGLLAKNGRYVAAVVGYVAQTFALGGFTAWAAPFLYRRMCLDLHIADFYFGAITVVTGLAGTAVGGWLADRWPGTDRIRAALAVCAVSSVAAAPLALVALMLESPAGFLVALGLCELAVFISVAPTNAAVLLSVPPRLRATAMAASIFAIHLLGDLVSPPIIGSVADALKDSKAACSGGEGLRAGMLLLPVALAVSAAAWWRGSRPARVGTTPHSM